MAIITRLTAGFYLDGTSEVFVRYDDRSNLLIDIVVRGNSDRLVEITVDGNRVEVAKNRTGDVVFDLADKLIRYRLPVGNAKNETPRIVCTWYKPSVEVIPVEGA